MPPKPRSLLFDDAKQAGEGRSPADPTLEAILKTCAAKNLPGRLDAYLAETRHSATDPKAAIADSRIDYLIAGRAAWQSTVPAKSSNAMPHPFGGLIIQRIVTRLAKVRRRTDVKF